MGLVHQVYLSHNIIYSPCSEMIKSYTKIELPPSYAWDLLDNEIQLQLSKDVGVTLIQKLVQLYALGVQYYESMHSYKYLYFQKKMTNLMTNPNLLRVGNDPSQIKESPSKQQNCKIKEKINQFDKKVLYKAGDVSETKVKDIVRCKEKEAEEYNNKVKEALGRQADSIKEKIMKRRQANQLKMSQSLIELTTHSSESSLEASAVVLERPRIKVDFTNIINENEEEDESVYDNEKNQGEVVESKDQVEQKPMKTRTRTKTLRTNNLIVPATPTHPHPQPLKRSKSFSPLREHQD